MTQLHHPYLVNLAYCKQTPQAVFLVLDLVLGGDLDHFQARFLRSPPTDAMLHFMSAQLVSGLEYMHSVHVIHRDIKPPNVLIDEDGSLRITDFGLSLKLKPGERLYDRTGTRPYMAPELHLASRASRRSYSFEVDWYALGVTLWEICAGGASVPPPVQKTLELMKSDSLNPGSPFDELSADDMLLEPLSRISQDGRAFIAGLLQPSEVYRLSGATIREHPYFGETNWAAVRARRQAVPWDEKTRSELAACSINEAFEERRTAAQALKSVFAMKQMEEVPFFDFVSPRAVVEEYMENVYQLRMPVTEEFHYTTEEQ